MEYNVCTQEKINYHISSLSTYKLSKEFTKKICFVLNKINMKQLAYVNKMKTKQ